MAESNTAYSLKYLQDLGFSKVAAAGIVGNLFAESGLNPKSVNPHDPDVPAKGIAQWHPDRWDNFQNAFAASPNFTPDNLQYQLQFVQYEMHQGGLDKQLNQIKDPGAAADFVDKYYERSSGQSRGAREKYAAEVYQTGDIQGSTSTDRASSLGELPRKAKDALGTAWEGFAKDALVNTGIGILAVLAIIAGLVFVLLSTKTGKSVAGVAVPSAKKLALASDAAKAGAE